MNVLIRHQNLFQDHKLVYKNKQLNVLMEFKKKADRIHTVHYLQCNAPVSVLISSCTGSCSVWSQ